MGWKISSILCSPITFYTYKIQSLITDRKGCIISTLHSHPDNSNWKAAHKEAVTIVEPIQDEFYYTNGKFYNLSCNKVITYLPIFLMVIFYFVIFLLT